MLATVTALERSFQRICNDSTPYEWDENHLTFSLMKELRSIFSNKEIFFNGWSKIVNWQSFKNRGNQEKLYGDIALLVNIQFSTGEVLKGVANIEAKRDYPSGNFEAIELPQLSRLCGNAPYSHLLFYCQKKQMLQLKFPDKSAWESNMWVSPINTVKELLLQLSPGENRNILRTSFPLTMFLTSRIFWGLDLDFRKDLYDDIAAGIDKLFNPAYIGVINIYYENQRPIAVNLADIWQQI